MSFLSRLFRRRRDNVVELEPTPVTIPWKPGATHLASVATGELSGPENRGATGNMSDPGTVDALLEAQFLNRAR